MKKIAFIIAVCVMAAALLGAVSAGENGSFRTILRLWPYVPPPVDGTGQCPVCAAQIPSADVAKNGPEVLNESLGAKLASFPSCSFIYPEERATTFALESGDEKNKAITLAGELNADAIFYPVLLRYRERVGNEYAASSPAAVAFHLHLLDAKTLKPLWSAAYSEEQQSLSQNILLIKRVFKRRFKWVSASRLVEDGVNKTMADFPGCAGTAQ